MSDDVWPLHNKISIPASSLLYPDVVGHGIVFDEASPNLLSVHVDIEACRVDKHGLESESIESYEDLMFYFETSKSCHASSEWEDVKAESLLSFEQSVSDDDSNHGAEAEIFFIRQKHPQLRLSVSEEVIKCLLSHYQVFSPFANIISSFSIEAGNYYEGSSGFYTSTITKNPGEESINELCYVLKYAEQDMESTKIVPWSIRQMAIYQKADSKTQETTSIIIQPSAEVWRRKNEIAGSTRACRKLSEHWTSLHMLILGTLNRNWTLYLQSLDISVDRLQKPLYSASVPDITIRDMQEISEFTELLLKYIHTQRLNIEVLNMLLEESKRPGGLEEFDKKDFSSKYRALEWAIESTLSETKILCSHAELVLNRANNAAAMLRDLITIQNNQLIQDITQSTNQTHQNTTLTEHSILPNLGQQSSQEPSQVSRSMKAMKFIMLLFLSLIFISIFLSMGFIHVTSAHDGLNIRADDDLWFYLALALSLSIVSLAAWNVWDWRARRQLMLKDVESNVKLE